MMSGYRPPEIYPKNNRYYQPHHINHVNYARNQYAQEKMIDEYAMPRQLIRNKEQSENNILSGIIDKKVIISTLATVITFLIIAVFSGKVPGVDLNTLGSENELANAIIQKGVLSNFKKQEPAHKLYEEEVIEDKTCSKGKCKTKTKIVFEDEEEDVPIKRPSKKSENEEKKEKFEEIETEFTIGQIDDEELVIEDEDGNQYILQDDGSIIELDLSRGYKKPLRRTKTKTPTRTDQAVQSNSKFNYKHTDIAYPSNPKNKPVKQPKCLNGGVAIRGVCECPQYFVGKTCNIEIDPRLSRPMENGPIDVSCVNDMQCHGRFVMPAHSDELFENYYTHSTICNPKCIQGVCRGTQNVKIYN